MSNIHVLPKVFLFGKGYVNYFAKAKMDKCDQGYVNSFAIGQGYGDTFVCVPMVNVGLG